MENIKQNQNQSNVEANHEAASREPQITPELQRVLFGGERDPSNTPLSHSAMVQLQRAVFGEEFDQSVLPFRVTLAFQRAALGD